MNTKLIIANYAMLHVLDSYFIFLVPINVLGFRLGKLPSEMDVIPKLFLQPGFSLQNPETFNAVFPWHQVEPLRGADQLSTGTGRVSAGAGRESAGTGRESAGAGRESRQSTKLLQERVSHLN